MEEERMGKRKKEESDVQRALKKDSNVSYA